MGTAKDCRQASAAGVLGELDVSIRSDIRKDVAEKSKKRKIGEKEFVEASIASYSADLLRRFCRAVLITIGLLNGITSVISGGQLMMDPSGAVLHMEPLLPMFQHLPFADIFFQDFFWCGVALALCNGLANLIASALFLKRDKRAYFVAFIAGCCLIAWTLVEIFVIMIPPAGSIVYLCMGTVQIASSVYIMYLNKKNPERTLL